MGYISKNRELMIILYNTVYSFRFVLFFGIAIISRVIFQPLPSVDPLLPILFLVGSSLKWRKALFFGSSTYWTSNFFVVGGQGWWSIPMALGGGLVCFCGVIFKNYKLVGIIVATLIYEIIVSGSWCLLFGFSSLWANVAFAIIHLVSNVLFLKGGLTLWEKVGRYF